MCYVNSYRQLVGTTEMGEDLVISESGAMLFLQELLPASILTLKLTSTLSTFQQKLSLYNCFSYFQVSESHQQNYFHSLLLSANPTVNPCACHQRGMLVASNFCYDCYNGVVAFLFSHEISLCLFL